MWRQRHKYEDLFSVFNVNGVKDSYVGFSLFNLQSILGLQSKKQTI